jgi:hypothetical protein
VRYGRWRNQFIIAPVAVGLAVFFWWLESRAEQRLGGYGLGFWVAIVLLGTLAVFSVLPIETQFDPDRRDIERRWRFFGVVTVFRRRLSLGQFRRICWRHIPAVERGDWHTWMVGLERLSGRPVYVSYFNVTHEGVCREAKEFALELSRRTGLPLSDEIQAG